jgi:hypothetical protein
VSWTVFSRRARSSSTSARSSSSDAMRGPTITERQAFRSQPFRALREGKGTPTPTGRKLRLKSYVAVQPYISHLLLST